MSRSHASCLHRVDPCCRLCSTPNFTETSSIHADARLPSSLISQAEHEHQNIFFRSCTDQFMECFLPCMCVIFADECFAFL